ncbi:MAG: hypothetical protein CM1200mP11_3020 [Nitrosopumilaceae archaeon]|nr:MAG: hypothetical protein CM1200mP11_3020 [Nitrosopumilaceae archaeon]
MNQDETLNQKQRLLQFKLENHPNCKRITCIKFTDGIVEEVSDKEMLDGMSVVGVKWI